MLKMSAREMKYRRMVYAFRADKVGDGNRERKNVYVVCEVLGINWDMCS